MTFSLLIAYFLGIVGLENAVPKGRGKSRSKAGGTKSVPRGVSSRLSLYLRYLERIETAGSETISSAKLGSALSLTAAQVRKDLAYFGHFGSAGVGYKVSLLIPELRKILRTDRVWSVVLVGLGNLGNALLRFQGFEKRGFHVNAVFDNNPSIIGSRIGGLTVRDVRDLPELAEDWKLAMLAVPPAGAQEVADALVEAGARGILNFAPISLKVPSGVHVRNVDLAVYLEQLSFLVT